MLARNFRLHAPDAEQAIAAALVKFPTATQIKVWLVFGDWWEVAALDRDVGNNLEAENEQRCSNL